MKKKNVLGQKVKAIESPISYKFDKINNKRDLKGFWLTAEHCDPSPSKNSDSFVVKEGYVSITPLHSEQTNLKFVKELSTWSFN